MESQLRCRKQLKVNTLASFGDEALDHLRFLYRLLSFYVDNIIPEHGSTKNIKILCTA
jgi:hypothetical protein